MALRPRSAFFLYMLDMRKDILELLEVEPSWEDLKEACSVAWDEMPGEEKSKFFERAK